MRDFGDYCRDPWNLEKLALLKGPDSILFGRGSTGGVVNQVSKTPQRGTFTDVSLSGGTDETRRGVIDYNQQIDGLGIPAAFRVGLMAHATGVAGRDAIENRRFGFVPGVSLGIGTPTRLTLSYFHHSENDQPDYGIPWLRAMRAR